MSVRRPVPVRGAGRRRAGAVRRAARALRARALTLALAESCTGGLVGARVTALPGSSRWFLGAVVAYDDRIKEALLGVPAPTLRRHGAVSAPVAAAMARGARRAFGAGVGLSVTGIAGPGGGTPAKPVGLVFAAVSTTRGTEVRRAVLAGSRAAVRRQAADLALNLLLDRLEEGR